MYLTVIGITTGVAWGRPSSPKNCWATPSCEEM